MDDYLPPRIANLGDVSVIVQHRGDMFAEMGMPRDDTFIAMLANSERWFRSRILDGSYLGFLITTVLSPEVVVAGGGLYVLSWPPTERDPGTARGYILNVYVEPEHRHRGLARRITELCLGECRARGVHSVTLHAADAARALYKSVGFDESNEMRLTL